MFELYTIILNVDYDANNGKTFFIKYREFSRRYYCYTGAMSHTIPKRVNRIFCRIPHRAPSINIINEKNDYELFSYWREVVHSGRHPVSQLSRGRFLISPYRKPYNSFFSAAPGDWPTKFRWESAPPTTRPRAPDIARFGEIALVLNPISTRKNRPRLRLVEVDSWESGY